MQLHIHISESCGSVNVTEKPGFDEMGMESLALDWGVELCTGFEERREREFVGKQ